MIANASNEVQSYHQAPNQNHASLFSEPIMSSGVCKRSIIRTEAPGGAQTAKVQLKTQNDI